MNKDNRNIFQAYINESEMSDRDKILNKLEHVDKLIPDDATVNWTIENGQAPGVTPQSVGAEPTVKSLIDTLNKTWDDESFASKLGLAQADWSGNNDSSGSIFWTSNDTRYHDVFGGDSHDRFQRLKPEHKEQYEQFNKLKKATDNYIINLMGGRPTIGDVPTDISPEHFSNQKNWRIALYPKSQQIDTTADRTHAAMGYGSGRNTGD